MSILYFYSLLISLVEIFIKSPSKGCIELVFVVSDKILLDINNTKDV